MGPPAANLDPVVRAEFLELVLDVVSEIGQTVVLSSHILSDVERAADRIAFLHQGKLIAFREIDVLKEQVRRLRLVFEGPAPERIDVPGVIRIRRSGREMAITVERYEEGLAERLAEQTGAHVDVQAIGLEQLFLDWAGGES